MFLCKPCGDACPFSPTAKQYRLLASKKPPLLGSAQWGRWLRSRRKGPAKPVELAHPESYSGYYFCRREGHDLAVFEVPDVAGDDIVRVYLFRDHALHRP